MTAPDNVEAVVVAVVLLVVLAVMAAAEHADVELSFVDRLLTSTVAARAVGAAIVLAVAALVAAVAINVTPTADVPPSSAVGAPDPAPTADHLHDGSSHGSGAQPDTHGCLPPACRGGGAGVRRAASAPPAAHNAVVVGEVRRG